MILDHAAILALPVTKTCLVISSFSAPRSGLAVKNFIDVGGECLPTWRLCARNALLVL